MTFALGWQALPLPSGSNNGAAYAISADGGTAVGYVSPPGSPSQSEAVYWTSTAGPVVIAGGPNAAAYGVSSDGSVIVGNGASQPFIWTASGGLASFAAPGDTVWGISADGSRIIGQTPSGSYHEACYWNRSGTKTLLGFLSGHNNSRARGASNNGAHIVGESSIAPAGTTLLAFLWSAAGGMVSLGLTGTATQSRAFGVSDAGTLAAGDLNLSTGNGAFQWTPTDGMTQLPISTGVVRSASAVSGDGSIIAGYSEYPGSGNQDFAYWSSAGVTVPAPPSISTAGTYPTGISANGRTAVGYTFGSPVLPWAFGLPAAVLPKLAIDDVNCTTIPELAVNEVYLDWSDDRGHSFGNPIGHPMGDAGEYLTSVQYQRLGYGRDRVFRIFWSVPTKTALQGAWIEAAPADS